MFRRSICKALALQQFNKSAAASCQALSLQQRRLIGTAFTPAYDRSSLLACQKTKLNFYNNFRTMATIPDSVVTKPASTENGIDISKKAVKVKYYSLCLAKIFCINNPGLCLCPVIAIEAYLQKG